MQCMLKTHNATGRDIIMYLLKAKILLPVILLSVLVGGSSVFALEMESKRDCVVCHVMWMDDFRTGEETLIEWQPGNVLMKDTQGVVSSEEICYSCHDGYINDSRHITWKFNRHPVFVKPSGKINIPPDMPLSVKDEIYCGTCHSAHGKGAAPHGDPTGQTSFFREVNIDSSLCEKCHRNEASFKGSNSHPLHLTSLEIPEKLIELGGKKAKDKKSIICETCHKVHGAEGEKIVIVDNSNSDLCIICHEKKANIVETKHDLRLTMPEAKNIKKRTLSESGPCGACHTPHNSAGKKIWARPLGPGNPATQMCLSCHNVEAGIKIKTIGEYSHPINIEASSTISASSELPFFLADGKIDPSGKIQCFTCHDVHTWDPVSLINKGGRDVEGDASNSFLRKTNYSSALCLECHADKKPLIASDHNLDATAPEEKNIQGFNAKISGPCGSCHVPHNAAAEKMWAKELSGNGDFVTQLCAGCHNEKGAAKDALTGDNNHPLDKDMKNLNITTNLPLYEERGRKTADGKVVCITCHDPHIWDPEKTVPVEKYSFKNMDGDASNSFLRKKNLSSGLCIECHSDKKQVIASDHNLEVTAPEEKNVQGLNAKASGPCGSCHVPHNAMANKLWAKKLTEGKDFATQLCTGCHNENGSAKDALIGSNYHPVDIALNNPGTSSLPLYNSEGRKAADGKVVCITCHDVHTWDPDKMLSIEKYSFKNMDGDVSNSFLRKKDLPSSSELCADCHSDKGFITGTDHDFNVTAPEAKNLLGQIVKESGQCGVCHVVHNSPNKLKLWARTLGPVSRDEETINALCTGCHSKGNVAEKKIPAIATHPENSLVNNILRCDRDAIDYTPIYDKLGKEINVGNISCPSCHNAHQWSPGLKKKGEGKNIEGNATNSFLRNVSYNNICIDCHGLDALFRFKYFHDPDERVERPSY